MSERRERPARLVDVPADQDAGGLGVYFRSAVAEPGEDTPLVKWRIRSTLQRGVERRKRALRLVLVGALMFAAGGVVGAVVQPFLGTRPQPQVEPAGQASPPSKPAAHRPARPAPPAPATVAEPEVPSGPLAAPPTTAPLPSATLPSPAPQVDRSAPATGPTVAAGPRKLAARLPSTPPPGPPPTRPSPAVGPSAPVAPAAPSAPASPTLAPTPTPTAAAPAAPPQPAATALPASHGPAEQALLAQAMRKLRATHEPAAALALLDEYQARYPSGALAPEAARMRTEALLLLGRKDAVLSELDEPGAVGAANDERLVLRGELRLAAGRWQAALTDFDAALGSYAVSPARSAQAGDRRTHERWERALWGRASARSQLGDDRGTRADLREYVRLFPHGRFAAQATRLLAEHP